MGIAKDALVYRVERVKEATPANAPILYQYGAFGQRLGKLRQCRSTLQTSSCNRITWLYWAL